jgi:hypothetical chaperone protein
MDGRLLQAIKTILPDETFKETIIRINETIAYEEFRDITAEVVISICQSLDTTLKDAHLHASDIDFVFLTGGSSLVVNIRQIFAELFGESKRHTGDTFASVGQGLVLSAPPLFK